MTAEIPIHELKQVAAEAARLGGEVTQSYFGRLSEFRHKKDAGLVTEADTSAEEKIISLIKETYPRHSILAEETGVKETESAYTWVIDPLDGTTNFTHQIPIFCTSVALQKNKEIIVAAVFDPLRDHMYTASKGEGAFLNGKPIQVSQEKQVKECLFATGFAYQKGEHLSQQLAYLQFFMEASHGIRRSGSAVWDFCQVACGHFDGFFESKLQPWDVAAGILLVQEAGGTITNYKNQPTTIHEQEIAASNGFIHEEMLKFLRTT